MGRKKKKGKRLNANWNIPAYKDDMRDLMKKAFSGELDEEGRSELAIQMALLKASRVFSMEARSLLVKLRGNLGLVQNSKVIYPVNGVIPGTGENGEDEYLLIRFLALIGEAVDYPTQRRLIQEFYEQAEKEVESESALPTTVVAQPSIQ